MSACEYEHCNGPRDCVGTEKGCHHCQPGACPVCDMPGVLRGLVPSVGSVWLWEPEKPHARQSVVVTAVKWNGEEVMVESESIDGGGRYWNDLSRWIEATVFEGSSGRPTPEGSTE